ncbi:hypothetical protein [Streptomyces sp. NPDC018352]|uniref:hypothetical protein n=1 Tax=Streptomyces sp. NPDC018352 TaxID=3157194 RepID=UPI0033CF506E
MPAEPGQRLGLTPKALHLTASFLLAIGEPVKDLLEGDVPVEFLVASEPDAAHAALSDGLDQSESAIDQLTLLPHGPYFNGASHRL